MATVADALRAFAPGWLNKFRVSLSVRKVFSVITRCRTGALGGVWRECTRCDREHWAGRSCGNRHCPTCGGEKTQVWLTRQSNRLLPGVHHFLVTFTVPRELGAVLRRHQREGYRCLFDSGADSIRDVGGATKALRDCQLGFFGVLHTWGRDPLVYHPHVHFVVPGGGVKVDQHGRAIAWQTTPRNFFVHHGTLIKTYKAKLADQLRAAGLYQLVPAEAWNKPFVVDIKPVGDGRSVLAYLAPYVHRVAISDHRIKSVDETSVTYSYRPSKTKTDKTRKVPGEAFVSGFAQHILPNGFQKIRHYGWMSSNSKVKLEEVRMLSWFALGWVYWLASGITPRQPIAKPRPMLCDRCGAEMRIVAIEYANTATRVLRVLPQHSMPYLDSG